MTLRIDEVAPPGLEPGRSYEPEILNPRQAGGTMQNAGKLPGVASVRRVSAGPCPRLCPTLPVAPLAGRATAVVFEVLTQSDIDTEECRLDPLSALRRSVSGSA